MTEYQVLVVAPDGSTLVTYTVPVEGTKSNVETHVLHEALRLAIQGMNPEGAS